MFSFVSISQVIGREGWYVFCTSQEIGCHLQNNLQCFELALIVLVTQEEPVSKVLNLHR